MVPVNILMRFYCDIWKFLITPNKTPIYPHEDHQMVNTWFKHILLKWHSMDIFLSVLEVSQYNSKSGISRYFMLPVEVSRKIHVLIRMTNLRLYDVGIVHQNQITWVKNILFRIMDNYHYFIFVLQYSNICVPFHQITKYLLSCVTRELWNSLS